MNLWVRYKEKWKNRKNEGENEERKIECLKLEFYVVPRGKLSTQVYEKILKSWIKSSSSALISSFKHSKC